MQDLIAKDFDGKLTSLIDREIQIWRAATVGPKWTGTKAYVRHVTKSGLMTIDVAGKTFIVHVSTVLIQVKQLAGAPEADIKAVDTIDTPEFESIQPKKKKKKKKKSSTKKKRTVDE